VEEDNNLCVDTFSAVPYGSKPLWIEAPRDIVLVETRACNRVLNRWKHLGANKGHQLISLEDFFLFKKVNVNRRALCGCTAQSGRLTVFCYFM
jgi:hypothetical protein